MTTDNKGTNITRKRYDRIAPIYDLMDSLAERLFYSKWRELLWNKVEGSRILEVGVGTGKNFPYHPINTEITAIDFSEKMLGRAVIRAEKGKVKVDLHQMDVQSLEFADNTFDTVTAAFVFCSVPDPIRGLEEVKRVVKPGGKVVLLEHVLSANRIIAALMNLVNPLVSRIMGPDINRRTVDNVAHSGIVVQQVTELAAGIFKLIEARKVSS